MPRPSRRAASTKGVDGDRLRRKHDDELSSDDLDEQPQIKYPRTGKRGAPQVFPRKLYEILQHESEDVIAWTDSGKSFVIKDMDVFVTHVLMKYFRHQKYSSFQRQLNLYGFRKISKGAETGAYCHEHFLKDEHDKLRLVRRTPQASTRTSSGKQEAARRPPNKGRARSSGDEGVPMALMTEPVIAWKLDEDGKVRTMQPGALYEDDDDEFHDAEVVPVRVNVDAAAALDALEQELLPDLDEDLGVLEGQAIARSPITSQPGLVVFDNKITVDHNDLADGVSKELNDLSTSVTKLMIEPNDPFEIPQFQASTSSIPDESFLLDFASSNPSPLAPEARDSSTRFRSLSMTSDDWPIPQNLDQLDPMASFFMETLAHQPPEPITMER